MPLILPDQNKTYNILAIDPGINNTGLAVFTMTMQGQIVSAQTYTFTTDKVINTTGIYEENHSDRMIKLYKLRQVINEMLNIYNPTIVVCESPFYNSLSPMAYSSIIETSAMIKFTVVDFNINIQFTTIEPLSVKKFINAGNTGDKDKVKQALKRINELMFVLQNDIEILDEHSCDALAIGLAFIYKFLR